MRMKFCRNLTWCGLLLIAILFSACSAEREPANDPGVPTDSSQQNSVNKTVYIIPEQVSYFSGQISPVEQPLSEESVEISADGLNFRGVEYVLYCDTMTSYELSLWYHWYIDLDCFSAIAQTPAGALICSPFGEDSAEVLLLCNSEKPEEASCYVRRDSSILDVRAYELDDFTVSLNGEALSDSGEISDIWRLHTDENESSSIYFDGETRTNYLVELQSVNNPWLRYCFQYQVFGDSDEYIEIFNINDSFYRDTHPHLHSNIAFAENEVRIGDSIYSIKKKFKDNILLEQYSCVVWETPEGYYIACTGQDGQAIRAVVKFSKDLELLEANGIEPIKEINQEEWIEKSELEFVAQYGSCHFDFGSGLYIPSYVSEPGLIYFLYVDDGIIKDISSFSPEQEQMNIDLE